MKLDIRIRELIALGSAIGANCHPCLRHHAAKAREEGIPEDEIAQAIEVGKSIRAGARGSMDRLVEELLGERSAAPTPPDVGCGCAGAGIEASHT